MQRNKIIKVVAYPVRTVYHLDHDNGFDSGLRLRYNDGTTAPYNYMDVFGPHKIKIVQDRDSVPSDKGYALEIDTSNGSVISSVPLKEKSTDRSKHLIQVGPMDKNGICPIMCGSYLVDNKCLSFVCPTNKQQVFNHVFTYLFGKELESRDDYQNIIKYLNSILVEVPSFTPFNFNYILNKLRDQYPFIPEIPTLTIPEVMLTMPKSLLQDDLVEFVTSTYDQVVAGKKCKHPKIIVERLVNTSFLKILPIFIATEEIDRFINYLLTAK